MGKRANQPESPRLTVGRPILFWLLIAVPSVAFAQDQAPQQPPDEQLEAQQELTETIVVTGSRIPRPNQTSDSPIQTVQPEDFTITGVPNVEQTLNQLPQLVAGITNTSNFPGTGAATLDLRGLGSVRTLVIVNGRRWIANNAGGVPEVDANTIAASLISRVDVVTGGASAVYGSDAVTGVINFVLNDRLRGLHLDATQNITQLGDGAVSNADLSYGASFLDGRAKLILSGGWLRQDPILQSERIFSIVSLTDACVIPGTRAATGASELAGVPITDCVGPNELGFAAGGSPNIPQGRIAGIFLFPVAGSSALTPNMGLTFDPDGQPIPFNADIHFYNFAPANYLQVGFRRVSANFFLSFEISRALTLHAELSYIRTRSPQQQAPVPAVLRQVPLNLDNPFLTPETSRILEITHGRDASGNAGFLATPTGLVINPAFTGDADGIVQVQLTSRLEGVGARQIFNERTARRGLLGARGAIGDWNYDLFFSSSRVRHEAAYRNSASARRLRQAVLATADPVTGAISCIDPSDGCAPANIFGAANLSAEAADFVRTHPVDVSIVKEQVAEASVRRDLPLFAAGAAGVVLGSTWRRTSYSFVPDPSLFTSDDLGFAGGAPAAGSTQVWELFSEARIPLVAGKGLVRELSAELGLRYSRYDSVGTTWTYKALGSWVPADGLRVRGGYQRAVRAPNVRELFQEDFEDAAFLLDPCSAQAGLLGNPDVVAACIRNGVPATSFALLDFETFSPALTRGNPDADAEVADTWTIGAVVTPRGLPGLSVAVDFYDVRITNAIRTLDGGGAAMVIGCILGRQGDPAAEVCQHYERDSDGFVSFMDQSTANIPFIRARGVDWQLGYRRNLPWGLFAEVDRVELSLAGTRYLRNGTKPNDSLDEMECIGTFRGLGCNNTLNGAVPRWKLRNSVTYETGPVSLTLRHRWFSATLDGRAPLMSEFGFTYHIPEEGRVLESRHYFDAATTFALANRFDLTLGVNNLTNAKPAINGNLQIQANTDPSLYDVLGRRFFATVRSRIR